MVLKIKKVAKFAAISFTMYKNGIVPKKLIKKKI